VPLCYYCMIRGQVEDIIEARARSLNITAAHCCYELLYSYHFSHNNYRKGKHVYRYTLLEQS